MMKRECHTCKEPTDDIVGVCESCTEKEKDKTEEEDLDG
ncbi:hypothetical protein LCGC14_0464590 [marine sediment metagenome]|uniref:Uncharacterized protein n=1 Tax=marine sediment metagenome TaxID=412755 RepID=A0A0F9SWV4_9ZZZZ